MTDMNGWTNYHCHTNVDWDVEIEMTPGYYAGLLGPRMRRVVVLNHGYDYYVLHERHQIQPGRPFHEFLEDDALRAAGNARARAAIEAVRALGHPDVFAGIETDLMRDGRPMHDPQLADEFDVVLYGDHYLDWVVKLDTVAQRVRAWLDHTDAVLARPDLDVFAHPFRELRALSDNATPMEAVERVLRWAAERNVGLELNSHEYVPEAATVRMLRFAADHGVPVVVGTDAHKRDRITAFEVAEKRLTLAGLTPDDLFIPEAEDFVARKGRRNDPSSRPSPRVKRFEKE
jgi:histidinol phosphatase-like PHP family hydrolase